MLLCRRGFTFVSTGKERLWIHFWLRKIRFDQGRPPEKSPMEMNGPDDPTFQCSSAEVSSKFYIQKIFETAG